MSRLALVGTPWVNPVTGADRDIQLLPQISIVVSEKQAEAPVRVMKPPFENGRHALPGIVRRPGLQLLRAKRAEGCKGRYQAPGGSET